VRGFGWLKRQTDPGQARLEVQQGWFEAGLSGWEGWTGLSPQAAERVWVANRCIHLNATQISSMELRFETSAPAGKSTPTWVDPGPDPVWYPNGINDAVYSAVSSLYAYGDAFLYITARYADGWPSGWTVVDPRVVEVELRGGQRAYRVAQTPVDPGDVVHILRNPVAGQLRGTPALTAYGPYVTGLLAGAASAANLAANPIPNAILKSEQKLTEEQAREIQDQWVERSGLRRGAPAVLPPKLDFELLAFSPKDLLLLEAQQWDAKVIATAFGVPVFILNMAMEGALVYQNPASLGEFWWRFELQPMALSVSEALTNQMLPRGDSVVFDASELFAPLAEPAPAAPQTAAQPGGDVVPLKPVMEGI
jgi:HK97 family phage portal protein